MSRIATWITIGMAKQRNVSGCMPKILSEEISGAMDRATSGAQGEVAESTAKDAGSDIRLRDRIARALIPILRDGLSPLWGLELPAKRSAREGIARSAATPSSRKISSRFLACMYCGVTSSWSSSVN